ncbi:MULTISPECIES: 3-hydroxy-5-phosphonooxypentane-2,4-dione thiolase [Microbacterium]|uniref:3-hydroxy-5-phosphonooxypentane-2,4-dione thiolase n=1 Tax=Microbacterium wangchenii TaxID=2541726 RepID=A0ABX5SU55_9MICO|nr:MULTISPECIES: 3-hydroxy-5-phosphonooxypentane-2,4-dione thiolase [Microbacterium]MCK6067348.1 3-hydroxy-5-phosphonooxypentane-2,4-dione thiolase [Microbacterium sp. EYE_512]QBR89711.1 3-hydroxy-5-phosphonooxypentane-2,4-dione thiolase [Microbacterium wangchenii]TFV85428.1 3-hydroxy-5-phosphonooxypentane-2,4-dione thiolase [Microbacterium sp. dk485]TXK16691.1 3-hydroxy-5-phosphonooxypentane-2,4-dione thiolase [Microbacterium wangchenii]
MADLDDLRDGTDFSAARTAPGAFHLKGQSGQDWGLRARLSRVFDPSDGKTVMLAFDHGYFQGPTSGLENLERSILPLVPQADALMCTRGALRTTIPADNGKGIVLRASGGPSVLKELSDEELAVSIDDAVRLDAAALAVQVFVGGENETKSIKNLTTLVDQGQATGIPVLAVTAVGRDMVRDARYFRLATRISAELGAAFVKTYYVEEGFETITSACPVPIVIAGGKKVEEQEALRVAYQAMQEGAAGVDMGRNVFQSEHPAAMLAAVRGVVHDGLNPADAFELFQSLSH